MDYGFERFIEHIDERSRHDIKRFNIPWVCSRSFFIGLFEQLIYRFMPLLLIPLLWAILPSDRDDLALHITVPVIVILRLRTAVGLSPRMKWELTINLTYTLSELLDGPRRIYFTLLQTRLIIYSYLLANSIFYICAFAFIYHASETMLGASIDVQASTPTFWSAMTIANVLSFGAFEIFAPQWLPQPEHFTWSLIALKMSLLWEEIAIILFLYSQHSKAHTFRGSNLEEIYAMYQRLLQEAKASSNLDGRTAMDPGPS